MDLIAALGTAAMSSVINTCVIVALYTFWIIPQIVQKVKVELLAQIENWIESIKGDLSGTIAEEVGKIGDKIRRVLAGSRGSAARNSTLAERFLLSNLPNDEDEDNDEAEELRDSVINEAIGRYGASIVNSILEKIAANKSTNKEVKVW